MKYIEIVSFYAVDLGNGKKCRKKELWPQVNNIYYEQPMEIA